MPVMILVALWSSFDVGFLSMLSGMLRLKPRLAVPSSAPPAATLLSEPLYC